MRTTANILLEKGVSPSIQRLKVYEFLKGTDTHPRVVDIYQALKLEIPSLSKTTVYNVVKLLSSKGLVKELHIEANESRYDACVEEHGHFKCKVCGCVSDVFFTKSARNFDIGNKVIDDVELNITGICEKCLN